MLGINLHPYGLGEPAFVNYGVANQIKALERDGSSLHPGLD